MDEGSNIPPWFTGTGLLAALVFGILWHVFHKPADLNWWRHLFWNREESGLEAFERSNKEAAKQREAFERSNKEAAIRAGVDRDRDPSTQYAESPPYRRPDRAKSHGASPIEWHRRTVASLDLETTGLDPLQDRIVQAALVFIEPNGTVGGGWSGIIDPGVEIPSEASAVHGITTEIARAQGVSPKVGLMRLADTLHEVAASGMPLVIFNAPFDWPFLLAEAARHGVEVERVNIIDPLVCDRALDPYRKGKRTLVAAAEHYGVQLLDAHDAQADAVAAAAVARAIAAQYRELGERAPPELQATQAGWHAEWARSYTAYLLARGEHANDIDAGWPLSERTAHLPGGAWALPWS